jgi:putative phosphoribosyl transferase
LAGMFVSREDAGQRLGRLLQEQGTRVELVLGLPRGGVVVAAQTARILGVALETLVVRKVGHPLQREFAVGALAEQDILVLDPAAIGAFAVRPQDLRSVVVEERERLRDYEREFHGAGIPILTGRRVLLVDDGLATGATTEAAVLSARKRDARWIGVAAPVASTHAVDRLKRVADEVIVLLVDADFEAVGRYYQSFEQTSDEEVLQLLKSC